MAEIIDSGLIYAAGRGSRMGALTDDRPKPLLELHGRALIDYGVDLLKDALIDNIHINTAYLATQINAHFEGQDVRLHHEADGPYETGGTLKALASALPESIVTINSDVIFFDQNPIPGLIEHWSARYDALILLLPRERAIGHEGQGDFFWDGERLSRRADAPSAPYIFPGVQIIRPRRALDFDKKVFSTNLIWDQLIDEDRIGAIVYQGRWMDLGNRNALERAKLERVG